MAKDLVQNNQTNKILMKRLYHTTYFVALFAIILLVWLFLYLVDIRRRNVKFSLEIDAVKAERAIADNFTQTASIVANMNLQIEENPRNKTHINNILRRYRTNPSLSETFSWTIFSWADSKDKLVVDAFYGIIQNPIDLSGRDYISSVREKPGKFYLGSPVIGSTSKKWMIPGGMGLVDNAGEYIGTMTIGFSIKFLSEIIQRNIENENITVKLFDNKNQLPVFFSSAVSTTSFQDKQKSLSNETKILLDKAKVSDKAIYDISILGDQRGYLAKKIEDYDLTLILEYDKHAIHKELWSNILSRIVEIIVILIISGVLMFLIYKRENSQKKLFKKLKERAEVDNEAKTNLLRTISHDLRNYISGIVGLSNTIADNNKSNQNSLTEETKDFCKMISNQSSEMLDFVQELLDINQAESGIIRLGKIEKCNIGELVDKILTFNRFLAEENKIDIVSDVKKNIPLLKCDKRRFRQILDNLIINAIKYSPENSEVKISAKYLKSENKIYIEIADKGIGMSEQDIAKAFSGSGKEIDKSAVNKPVDSHGIGLPLVKKLVSLHNAEIKIDSEIGKGTKIKLWFDVNNLCEEQSGEETKKNSIKEYEKKQIKMESPKTILLVDDDMINLMLLKHIIDSTNHKILIAHNTEEALDILVKKYCDLIFTDLNMPGLSGIQAIKLIRSDNKYKEYNKIPIIVITGNSDEETKRKVLDAGANHCMSKPLIRDNILKVVNKLLF